ncbi:MAG: TIGR03086 family metal-binding protein [Trebonia sp.]
MTDDDTLAAARALADLKLAIAGAETIVAGISDGQWDAPTPCSGLDVRDLVNHLIAGNQRFASLVDATPRPDSDADPRGAKPAEAFRAAAASLITALGTPGMLDRTYQLPFGQVPGVGLIEIRLTEHLGHGWDLATATGQPAPFPDDLAQRGLAVARRQLGNRPAGDHSPFGAEVEISPDAPAIDRLAAFLGRTV